MISTRPATIADSKDIFTWRNDEHTRLMSINSEPVKVHEHENWFATTLNNSNRCLLICEAAKSEKVGVTRFDILGENAEMSINIAPNHRGKGLAVTCINSSIAYFKHNFVDCKILTATIKANNLASQKCFVAAGFCLETTRKDIQYYTLNLS